MFKGLLADSFLQQICVIWILENIGQAAMFISK